MEQTKSSRPLLSTGAAIALGLSAIIVTVIIVGGVIVLRGVDIIETLETLDINVTGDVDDEQGEMQVNAGFNQELIVENFNWELVPLQDVVATVQSFTGGVVQGSEGAVFVEAIDLTGDGISEGIFSLPGFNDNVVAVMRKVGNGYTLARMVENPDHPSFALLHQLGGVQYSVGYGLLPEINGFYILNKSLDQSLSPPAFTCNSLTVFQWSDMEESFVMNSIHRDQYYAQECS